MENLINVAEGINFSGRSNFLKTLCHNLTHSIYIGEIPSNYLSGISPTVRDELNLFSQGTNSEISEAVKHFLNDLSLEKIFKTNPYLLSGGEQAIITILSGILREPRILAIDTVIEQLDKEWRDQLINLFEVKINQNVILSDNRVKEYGINYNREFFLKSTDYPNNFVLPVFTEFVNLIEPCSISIKELFFSYNQETQLLNNINLDFTPGEIYFLNGKNGAGKSTLAKILTGILKAPHGYIKISGKQINPFIYPGKFFGYSFQNPDEQLFSNTVHKEINGIYDKTNSKILKFRSNFIDMFGLRSFQAIHPFEMPFVMRKRIALAATLATERPWYIIDEPTIGQDDQYVDFLVTLFKEMASKGKGIIIISHSKAFSEKFRAKTIHLKDGTIRNSTYDNIKQEKLA